MIILENRVTKKQHTVNPTFFPDGTSQVWKLPEDFILGSELDVIWYFQNEAEIIHVYQLLMLVKGTGTIFDLFIPFLPYGRQDKSISNTSTFSLYAFQEICCAFKSYIEGQIYTVDAHNPDALRGIKNIGITEELREIINKMGNVIVIFPDEGACKRYGPSLYGVPQTYAVKERDQLTGNILKTELKNSWVLQDASVLIVDDLIDGGGTFIKLAEDIEKCSPYDIKLYATHGIFSKGLKPLLDAGFSKIITTDSRLQLKENSKLEVICWRNFKNI